MTNQNERLKNLRLYLGMNQKEFAAELGIGQPQLSQVERGLRAVTDRHLIAAQLRFGLHRSFFDADPITYTPTSLNYRRHSLTPRQQTMADTTFGLTEQAVRESADGENSSPRIELKDRDTRLSDADIESIAADIRSAIGVPSDKVINNVTRCVERLGILVTGLENPNLPEDKIDGISTPERDSRPFVITLNLDKPGDRLRFSVAHELGHLVLHTENPPLDLKTREAEADAFASAFLMPRRALIDQFTPDLTLLGYSQLKAGWGTSIQALIRRSKDLGVITPDRYRKLQMQISSRGWRKNEPVEIPKEHPSTPTPTITGSPSTEPLESTPQTEPAKAQVISLFGD